MYEHLVESLGERAFQLVKAGRLLTERMVPDFLLLLFDLFLALS
jgi:hypothetical protein